MSDASEDGEISDTHDYGINDDSLDIKPPQNQAGSKHKSSRDKHDRKRRDKHKHRRHESRRQRREHKERRGDRSADGAHRTSESSYRAAEVSQRGSENSYRSSEAALREHAHLLESSDVRARDSQDVVMLEPVHDSMLPPSRSRSTHERRESRRERRAERQSRKARDQAATAVESRMEYRDADEDAAPTSRDSRHRGERRDPPQTEVDIRRERFLQAMRANEHQKEMSRRELEARRQRRELEKQRQREQKELDHKRDRDISDDREANERRKRSKRLEKALDDVLDQLPDIGERSREADLEVHEPRERGSRDVRERESRTDRQEREREGRNREPREGRDRGPREGRERDSRNGRERDYREDRDREKREDVIERDEGESDTERIDVQAEQKDDKGESDQSSAGEDGEGEDSEDSSSSSSSSSEASGEESVEGEEEEEEDGAKEDSPAAVEPESRSPTPPVTGRRWRQTSEASVENGGSPADPKSQGKGSPRRSPTNVADLDSSPPSPVLLKDKLPPYLPAVHGCRNVEEFNCLNRIEEGTYGVVYRAVDKRTKEIVALKRLKMENEKEGFPITSLREINTLLKAQHENIVHVREIVVGSNMDKIYIVMDYVEHDLKSLMQTMKAKKQSFTTGEVKCLLIQMLRAVRHLHDNWILHRDLKTSNLLLSHKGILKVGDFGLAREYGSPLKPYTPIVVTLWYRAPELLLGVKEYACPIDMWSVGCIFGELVRMEPMFPGKSEADQINRIFKELGTPNEKIWPGYGELPAIKKMTFTEYPYNQLATRLGVSVTEKGVALMNKLLTYDPKRRLTADEALSNAYFDEQPRPIEPSMFPTWPAKSEMPHKKTVDSPKPPSGRKNLGDEDVGFQLGGAGGGGGGFSLKF